MNIVFDVDTIGSLAALCDLVWRVFVKIEMSIHNSSLTFQFSGSGPAVKSSDTSCPHCDKEFNVKSRRNLNRHIQIVHMKLKPFQCRLCEATFSMKHHLKMHMRTKHLDIEVDWVKSGGHVIMCNVNYSLWGHVTSTFQSTLRSHRFNCSL